MNKSRKLGWHGFVDTKEGIFDAIQEMADLKMLPPLEKTDGGEIKYHGYWKATVANGIGQFQG